MIKFLISIFFTFSYTIGLSQISFQFPSTNIATHVFWTFISENLAPPLIFHVPILFENWSEWCHILKNTTLIEIIITTSTVIHPKENKNFVPCSHAIFHSYCCYNFNPCGNFENMAWLFNQELGQGKEMVP